MMDVSIKVYLFEHKIIIPTSARTEAGFYLIVEPWEIIDAQKTNNLQSALKQALARVAARGHPIVPTPDWQKTSAKLPFLKQAGGKSQREFDQVATSWLIHVANEKSDITPYRPREDRGFEEDLEGKEILPSSVGIEGLARRMAEIISQAIARQSESQD